MRVFGRNFGNDYPLGPKTQEWMKDTLHPTFCFPSMVRFSWMTVKVMLDKSAHPVKWYVSEAFLDYYRGLDKRIQD
ncbi:hypothetical protein F5J12DRAFT_809958 [Pisolithus orientalis]|uniref:uncharacterized protein n=1 Tax=Pisolithus orientalis TaxID=936130 RepID=UPI00222510F5|nr:uncharacterized protein F5J12DRAFT_809958 [Pisolithus orientalis]KAI6025714.1 hypothetical protein F5J12DRAFT_809958 [Pisolithus orientalis]